MADMTLKDRNESAGSGIKRRLECDHEHTNRLQILSERRRKRERHKVTKDMRFVSLHHHSTYSSLDGFQMPESHVRRATELRMGALAMTEHGNVSSHDNLEVAARKLGVKPIYGCELYTGKVGEGATQRKYHLTVLAANPRGYRNLLQLVSRSWKEGFYYEPTVSWEMLKQHKEGLILLSGCQGSLLFCSAVGGKLIPESEASYSKARKVARAFKAEFGESYYIECQAFPQLEKTRQFNPMAERLSRDLGIPLVATMDCHYTAPEEREIQKILHNVRGGGRKTLEEQAREWGYTETLCPPVNDAEIYRKLRGTGLSKLAAQEAIINTELINQRIVDFDLPKLPMLKYPLPPGYDSDVEIWRDWLREGWKYRGCHKLPAAERKRYKEQLLYECSIIEEKGFCSYFLIVSDVVRWAKRQQIPVGPARGSAAASLACWLLRITEVNPMDFPNLVFERFIDVSRQDLPDIDLDFASGGRPAVREYLVSKYGSANVNNLGTFNYYKSKNSLDDVARVFKVPTYKIDTVKGLLIERSSGDMRASATIEDTVGQFEEAKAVFDEHPEMYNATYLEGNVRGIGVHSAGLIVSNGDIRDVCAVYTRKVKGVLTDVVSVDKYDAERRGMLKLDFLGLSTMEMIAEALRHLGMQVEDLYGISLDDEKVIDGFRQNDVVGIFQFDGRAMRSVNGALKPDSFKEICDVNALSRPGPLHNGAANEYIDIKRGVKRAELLHEALRPITEDTHHQIVYQEQILRIVREIGDFDWTHAALIRKIMSKKHGEAEFNSHWLRFWGGVQKLHPTIEEHVAKKIWGMCITAGAYAFNAAHCVSYGMLAYWTMWLKVYHPAVFYAASLAKMPDTKHYELLRDAARHGIEIRGPHVKHSDAQWKVEDGAIRAGFGQIKGVGEKMTDKILEYRECNGLENWEDLQAIQGVGPKKIAMMKDFAEKDDPFDVFRLDRLINSVRGELPAWGLPEPTHNAAEVPYERGQDTAITWLGVVQGKNLRDIFESNRARTGIELKPEEVKHPELNEFLLMLGYDGEEVVSLRFNRFIYPKFRDAIWGIKTNEDLVLVRGVKPGWRTAREIYVRDMWVIENE